jgi:hypothetical protein
MAEPDRLGAATDRMQEMTDLVEVFEPHQPDFERMANPAS